MLQQIKTGLESLGYKPEVHDLNWFQDDYGLKTDENDEEGDNDEDEEDDDEDEEEDDEDEEEDEK